MGTGFCSKTEPGPKTRPARPGPAPGPLVSSSWRQAKVKGGVALEFRPQAGSPSGVGFVTLGELLHLSGFSSPVKCTFLPGLLWGCRY